MKKNYRAVGFAVIGMFVYGFLKSTALGKFADGCPRCTADRVAAPHRLLKTTVVAPIVEEAQYRGALSSAVGPAASAALFGLGHARRGGGSDRNVARIVEAGLAGGLVYQTAYDHGGVVGASLVHGAHNLGTDLGFLIAMKALERERGSTGSHGAPCLDCALRAGGPGARPR